MTPAGLDGSLVFLLPAAFAGGFLDAIVGGGGLILVPALFGALPAIAPATLLGTNKASSLCGLVSSVVRYVPSVAVPWRIVAPAMTAGFLASCAGAGTVRIIPAQFLRPVIPFMLAAVLIYTLRHRHLGAEPRARPVHERGVLPGVLLIGALGFYDGFLGPGTGAMMMFALVRFYGLDFLGASASARLLNLATNAGALLVFAVLRELIWPLAIALAAASIVGAQIGARLAIARGSRFVRLFFIVMSSALIAKTAWDAWHGAAPGP